MLASNPERSLLVESDEQEGQCPLQGDKLSSARRSLVDGPNLWWREALGGAAGGAEHARLARCGDGGPARWPPWPLSELQRAVKFCPIESESDSLSTSADGKGRGAGFTRVADPTGPSERPGGSPGASGLLGPQSALTLTSCLAWASHPRTSTGHLSRILSATCTAIPRDGPQRAAALSRLGPSCKQWGLAPSGPPFTLTSN